MPKPERAKDYRMAARYDIDRRLVEKHMRVAFANITDAVNLKTRHSSLRYLREYFGLTL